MEKISIIIPVYNVEEYLRQCIESVIGQTYNNIEIILVDDGSTDNSGSICDEYREKDSRIIVLHKENGGLSDARNTGINIATGKYITFIDSDDYISADMCQFLYDILKKEMAQISCCNRFMVYKNRIEVYGKKEHYEVMDSERAIEMMCTWDLVSVSAYAKLYLKDLFKEIRYPKGKINEDMYTTHKVFDLAEKIVYDATAKYYYRQRKGSITNSKKINVNAMDASKEMVIFCERKYPKIINSAIRNYVFASIGVYDNIIKSDGTNKNNSEIKKQILNEVKKYYDIVKKEKGISKARRMQLFLIRYSNIIYDFCFKMFDMMKFKIKKV